MTRTEPTLVCWHSERVGFEVLERALDALRNPRIRIARVLYLVQAGRAPKVPRASRLPAIEMLDLPVRDPTRHAEVYSAVRERVLPHLHGRGPIHVNVSSGTPAMHVVWIILHAGGAFPPDTRLSSSQYNPETRRTRIDPVEFPVTTWLSEVHEVGHTEPDLAVYEPQARSPAWLAAFERLARYARVAGGPLLVLGERGTGKTRIVETLVATLKRRRHPPRTRPMVPGATGQVGEDAVRDLDVRRRGAGLRREDAPPGCVAGRGSLTASGCIAPARGCRSSSGCSRAGLV